MIRAALLALCATLSPALASPEALLPEALLIVETPDGIVQYDLDGLGALPRDSFSTQTIWTEGPQEFTGVPLARLLQDAGIDAADMPDATVTATAVNDYAIQIPLSEIGEDYPIVAYLHNDRPMPLRAKGPLWIVYPYDADPAFRTEVTYARSIWQLNRLSVTR